MNVIQNPWNEPIAPRAARRLVAKAPEPDMDADAEREAFVDELKDVARGIQRIVTGLALVSGFGLLAWMLFPLIRGLAL